MLLNEKKRDYVTAKVSGVVSIYLVQKYVDAVAWYNVLVYVEGETDSGRLYRRSDKNAWFDDYDEALSYYHAK